MKKKLLLLFTYLFVNNLVAQVFYSENFNTDQTLTASGWTLISVDSNTGAAADWVRTSIDNNGVMASFSWYANVILTPDNYAFSPAINLTNVTGQIQLKYKHASTDVAWDAEKYTLYVTDSPDVASATTILHAQTTMNNINTLTEMTFDLSAYAGQTIHLCFRHHGVSDQFNIVIDDILVEKLVPNNLELTNVVVNPIITAGNYNFSGVVTNKGNNIVTSYQVNWQANGGAISTYDVTGVSIAAGATHNFTHSVPLNAVAGQSYALNFVVPTVNGVSDGDPLNNTLSKNTTVALGTTTIKPLVEKFTANWCVPCANYNTNTFNNFYTTNNANFTYIAYHASSTDSNFNTDSGARANYYAMGGFPTVYMNSTDIAPGLVPSTAQTNSGFTAAQAKPGYFTLNSIHSLNGNQINGTVSYNALLSGSYKLRIAVVENTTSLGTGTNGETSFKHVLRKMIPSAAGTDVSFTASQSGSFPFTADLAGLTANQLSNLSVVVFIQNDSNKDIYQSAYSVEVPLSLNDNIISQIKLYPNPATDYFRISNIEKANVVISDVTGKRIMSINDVTGDSNINVSELNSGIYFVNIKNENSNETIKFVKK